MRPRRLTLLAFAVILVACASPPASSPASPATGGANSASLGEPGRVLVIASRVEPHTIASKALRQEGVGRETTKRVFNADLAIMDKQTNWVPYLAESLPELNTDSWRLLPGGRMETTYSLKPNLAWHD